MSPLSASVELPKVGTSMLVVQPRRLRRRNSHSPGLVSSRQTGESGYFSYQVEDDPTVIPKYSHGPMQTRPCGEGCWSRADCERESKESGTWPIPRVAGVAGGYGWCADESKNSSLIVLFSHTAHSSVGMEYSVSTTPSTMLTIPEYVKVRSSDRPRSKCPS